MSGVQYLCEIVNGMGSQEGLASRGAANQFSYFKVKQLSSCAGHDAITKKITFDLNDLGLIFF